MICPKCKSPNATEVALFSSTAINCELCDALKDLEESAKAYSYKITYGRQESSIKCAPITITLPKVSQFKVGDIIRIGENSTNITFINDGNEWYKVV